MPTTTISLREYASANDRNRLATLERAAAEGYTICSYQSPTEDALEGLTPSEANEIAREDASLVYLAREASDITDADIAKLGRESAEHGDVLMAAICERALGGDEESIRRFDLDNRERAKAVLMTQADARAKCERAIVEARGQQ